MVWGIETNAINENDEDNENKTYLYINISGVKYPLFLVQKGAAFCGRGKTRFRLTTKLGKDDVNG